MVEVARRLTQAGHQVSQVETANDIFDAVRRDHPELLLLAPSSPSIDVANICKRIRLDYLDVPVFIVCLSDAPGSESSAAETFAEADGHLSISKDEKNLVDRVEDFIRIQRAENSLRQHSERLSAITAVQQEMAAAAPDQDGIMKLAASRAQQLTGADGAFIEVVEGDEIVFRAASGANASQFGVRLRMGVSFSAMAIRNDEILRCHDTELDPRVNCEECRTAGIRSMVVVPLRHQYNSMGALRVFSSRPNAFGEAEVQSLQLVTHFMSAAINQAVAFGAKQALLAEHTRTIVALRESEERFRSAFDHAAIGMALVATSGKWMKINRTLSEIIGYTENELRSLYFHSLTHPGDAENHHSQVSRLLLGEIGILRIEERCFHKSGTVVWVFLSVSLVRDAKGKPLYLIAQIEDITERRRADEQIKSSLREKEVLLKEIHHRVKNNLQVISSLLRLQSGYVKDSSTQELFRESQYRVRSMALIHEKLYKSQDLARIDFNEYLLSLVAMLFRSYGTHSQLVNLETHIDQVFLNIDTAIPVGLLINELVSNSLKYAFPNHRAGIIRIDFQKGLNDEFILGFRDDGVGLPEEFDLDNIPTLGLRLVKILASQIGGKLTFHRNGGTEFTVTFREQKEKDRK